MGKKVKEVRNKRVIVRMNNSEYATLDKHFKKTTCRRLSEYMRKVSLQQPVTVLHRNQSADDFLTQMLQLKAELNAIGNNFNQAVHKLHTLDRIPEFRAWIQQYEKMQAQMIDKVEQIRTRMNTIYIQWSPK
ncbi:MAG: hypothetical protein ABI472_25330 [Ginsengibacter sp.]